VLGRDRSYLKKKKTKKKTTKNNKKKKKTNNSLGSVASLLEATFYQGNSDRNHKLWNIVSTERYILHI
jgi:hypothetical protein